MNEQDASDFLFTVAKTIKRSFETPVILVTLKDYADDLFNMLTEMRTILLTGGNPESLSDSIVRLHLGWLHAVADVQSIRQQLPDKPQEIIYNAIDYSIQAMYNRYMYFKNFFENVKKTLSNNDVELMRAELEIIEEMQKSVAAQLADTKRCLQHLSDPTEFFSAMDIEVEELLNWLDNIHDHLAIDCTKIIDHNYKASDLLYELSETLKNIVDTVVKSADPEESANQGSIVRFSVAHDLEILNVVKKVEALDERIERLQDGSSAAIMALQHKKLYLLDRLRSLENIKDSLLKLQIQKGQDEVTNVDPEGLSKDNHIFSHKLPTHFRYRLAKDLIQLWTTAIYKQEYKCKSVLTILSVSDMKETFFDDLGKFTIDKHGRKIYEKLGDDQLYQANEHNELVPVNDTEECVYFYDDCGRYYMDENNRRIYHAHETASEYLLHPQGWMYKYKEVEDNVTYHFDRLGRYYRDENNQRVYRERNSADDYFHDGFGNLLKLNTSEDYIKECPLDAMVTEESMYLKKTVGKALKECLAKIVLCQPSDPIVYLAGLLENYSKNMEHQQRRMCEEIVLIEERRGVREREELEREAALSVSSIDSSNLHEEEEETETSFNIIPDLKKLNY